MRMERGSEDVARSVYRRGAAVRSSEVCDTSYRLAAGGPERLEGQIGSAAMALWHCRRCRDGAAVGTAKEG